MDIESSLIIAAPRERVWSVLADFESWPTWTKSMRSLEVIGEGPVAKGSKVKVRQPGLAPAVYTITEWIPGLSFTWMTTSIGLATVANHRLEEVAGTTNVTLEFRQTGWASGIADKLFGAKARGYVQMEADGLKAASEAASGPG
jgi:uncharacterized membrane protein